MCLKYLDIPKEKEGIGYKVVRKINETTFKSFYAYFSKDGSGGVFSKDTYKSVYTTNSPTYSIGETYTVKHRRMAKVVDSEKTYRAGVHLYKNYHRSKFESREHHNYMVIVCKYEEAIFCDNESIVAMKITPLSIVE